MLGFRELAPGVHGLGTELVNWYLVEEGGRVTAVDAGLPRFARPLEADLQRLGYSLGDVEAVVLTHSDGDHTGVAPRFREAGARVLIHAADEAALRKPGPKKGEASPRRVLGNLWRREARTILADTLRHGGARPAKVEDAETYADGDVLDVPGRPRVIHTPGHTAGHSALLFEGKGVLFAGDALITHELITKGAGIRLMPGFVNEDNRAALASLARLEAVDADLVLVGHGDPWREGPAAAAAQARTAAQPRRPGSIRVEESIEIGRSPQAVWDLVVDPLNDPRWCPKVKSVEPVGERRWVVLHKPVPLRPPIDLTLEQLDLQPPGRLTLREEDEASVFHVEYRLEPSQTGTRLAQISEVEWKRLPRVLRGTFARGVRRDVRCQLLGLKQLLER